MELTAETLTALFRYEDAYSVSLLRSTFGSRAGILPAKEFKCESSFVRKSLEFRLSGCLAVLPSGNLLDVDESASLEIPKLDEGEYYVTVGQGEDRIEFECDEVPMSRPVYHYRLRKFEELSRNDELPFLRLEVEGGEVTVDRDYIPPFRQMLSDSRFSDILDTLSAKLGTIAGHPNLAHGDGRRTILHYQFMLGGFTMERRVDELLQLSAELAQSVRHHIWLPNKDDVGQIPVCSEYDVRKWFKWLDSFLDGASEILDGVVLKDETIDYDKLYGQLRKELFETLHPQLMDEVQKRVESLREDMQAQISETLKDFISGEFRRKLHDELDVELSGTLEQKLYSSLYEALYDALFVPEVKEEDTFTPRI